jgi:hypothetical protein
MDNGGDDEMAQERDGKEISTTSTEPKPPEKLTRKGLNELVTRAADGDRGSLRLLREALKSGDYPNWSQWFLDAYGNPVVWLKHSLGVSAGGKNDLAVTEAVQQEIQRIQTELEGPNPTAIERLLAERAAVCWFMVNKYEADFVASRDTTIRQAEYNLRRIDSANRRYLSALSTLARVRKMALPVLQVNIGTNQVNVSQAGV